MFLNDPNPELCTGMWTWICWYWVISRWINSRASLLTSLLYDKLQNRAGSCPLGLYSFLKTTGTMQALSCIQDLEFPSPSELYPLLLVSIHPCWTVPHSCLSGWSRTAVHHYHRTREAHKNGWWGDWHTDTEDYVHPCMYDDRNRLITALNCWCSWAARTVSTATFFYCHTFTDRFSRFVSVCLTIFPSVWVFGTKHHTLLCVLAQTLVFFFPSPTVQL